MRVKSLQDLQPVRQALAQAARQAALAAEQQRLLTAKPASDHALFVRAVGSVVPLRNKGYLALLRSKAAPFPKQRLLDEKAVLREAISDEFDASTLLQTDEQLSYLRPGVVSDIAHRLRAGQWSIQRQLDLHGLRTDEAREALGQFIRQAQRDGVRCLRIIHGKGLGSPGRIPVLKTKVLRWLMQKQEVLAFVQARPADGGAGALLVLLQPFAASHR